MSDPLPFALLTLFFAVLVASIFLYLPKWLRIPQTIVLFLLGIFFEWAASTKHFGNLGDSLLEITSVSPNFILFVLLPPLIFQSAFTIDFHIFKRQFWAIFLLAGPLTLLNIITTGLFVQLLLYEEIARGQWGYWESFLLASIISATDTVAVTSTLRVVGASETLKTTVEGESLLNDGSAFVSFLFFKGYVDGYGKGVGSATIFIFELSVLGPLFGFATALIVYFWLKWVYNEPSLEITIWIMAVYTTFYLADILNLSSVLSVVCFGLFQAARGKYAVSEEVEEYNILIWDQIVFIVNAVIFFLSGLLSFDEIFYGTTNTGSTGYHWWVLIVLYAILLVERLIIVTLAYPILRYVGYGIDIRGSVIVFWSGLRGGVSLALGLIIRQDTSIPLRTRILIDFFVSGIVFFTLVLNGSSLPYIYNALKFPLMSPLAQKVTIQALNDIENKTEKYIKDLMKLWIYSSVSWDSIPNLVPNLRDVTFKKHAILVPSPTQISVIKLINKNPMKMLETSEEPQNSPPPPRIEQKRKNWFSRSFHRRKKKEIAASETEEQALFIFFNAVKENYHHQYHSGILGTGPIHDLMEAVDTAMERENSLNSITVEWLKLKHSTRIRHPFYKYFTRFIPVVGTYHLYHRVRKRALSIIGFVKAREHILNEQVESYFQLEQFHHKIKKNSLKAKLQLIKLHKKYPDYVDITLTSLAAAKVCRIKRTLVKDAEENGLLPEAVRKHLVQKLEDRLRFLSLHIPHPWRLLSIKNKSRESSPMPQKNNV